MFRNIPTATLAAALLAAPAASRGGEVDLRCSGMDQTLSERLRAVLARDLPVSQAGVNEVMNRMALARSDCKRGRAERGLRIYADAEADLAELEAVDAAFVDPAAASAAAVAPQQ